jgi:hypothetical protein
MIQSQMAGQRYQMAYAGAGDFIALLDRGARVDAAELQAGLSGMRGPYFDAYRRLGVPAPEIAVGTPQAAPLLAPSPRRLFAAARAAVALPPVMMGVGGRADAGLAARA